MFLGVHIEALLDQKCFTKIHFPDTGSGSGSANMISIYENEFDSLFTTHQCSFGITTQNQGFVDVCCNMCNIVHSCPGSVLEYGYYI